MQLIRILSYFLIGFIALGVIRYHKLDRDFQHQQAQIRAAHFTPTQIPKTLDLPYTLHRPIELLQSSQLSPRNALFKLREEYRLPPDRRFILAFIEIQKFLAPDSKSRFEVRFENGGWQLLKNGNFMVQLGEFPDFLSVRNALARFSEQLMPATIDTVDPAAIAANELDGFSLHNAQKRLQQLNRQWQNGQHSILLIRQAADALARLSWAGGDRIEAQDNLMARALAFIVMAETGMQKPLPRQESMLAEAMGYHTYAKQKAIQLDANDPWKLYLLKQSSQLADSANQQGADADSVDLWLKQLAREHKNHEWIAWYKKHYRKEPTSIYALQTAHSLRGFYPYTGIIRMLPFVITVANSTDSINKNNWQALNDRIARELPMDKMVVLVRLVTELLAKDPMLRPDQVVNSIDSMAKKYSGPFLDQDGYKAFYRGIYFSSIYDLGLHYIDRRNDQDQAEAFSRYLADQKDPGVAELALWYQNITNVEWDKYDNAALIKDLRDAKYIGIVPLERTLDDLLPSYYYASLKTASTINLLFSRMDSRIRHRFTLARLAQKELLHIGLSEKLYQSIQADETDDNHYLTAWLGQYNNQPEVTIKVINDKNVTPYERGRAASLLTRFKPVPAETGQVLSNLIEQCPDNWKVHDTYIKYLQKQKQYNVALKVAQHWIKHAGKKRDSFDYWRAIIAISRQQVSLGQLDAAWDTINTITDSWFGGALYQATHIKILQGDLDGAAEWGLRAYKRYPTSTYAILNLVEILWRQHDYVTAAKLLNKKRKHFTKEDWHWEVGVRMADVFSDHSEEIPTAFAALLHSGLPITSVQDIIPALGDKGLNKAAFEAANLLKFPGRGQYHYDIVAFKYLEKIEGRKAALKWLDKKIPKNIPDYTAMVFFDDREYSLLWDMIPDPTIGEYPDEVWLHRATAYVLGTPLNKQRHKQLMDYFNSHHQTKYDKMGRLVLGIDDGKELFDMAMDPRTLSESAYYFGVAALKAANYSEAADWFKVSTQYSSRRNAEFSWSYNFLYVWMSYDQSMKVLAQKDKLILAGE